MDMQVDLTVAWDAVVEFFDGDVPRPAWSV